MSCRVTRRNLLGIAGASLLARPGRAQTAPSAPVVIAQCGSYGPALYPTLQRMMDQLGGLARLVRGKTVVVKVNLTGNADSRWQRRPLETTAWTHWAVIASMIDLLGRAGASRIRVVESPWKSSDPVPEVMLTAGWNPSVFVNAARNVDFENTNLLGRGAEYVRFPVPGGGHLFPAFDLNWAYGDCDVFVSIAKLKEHRTAGVTLSMKNAFGITPCTIYGDGAGVDEPALIPRGGRLPIHNGARQPSKTSPPENDPSSPRDPGYRVPRCVADLAAARPQHLQIIDGIQTITGGETAANDCCAVEPGLLIAGTNCVCTDAAGTAVMGFDPMAERGETPFENCDSTLQLAERHGIGTRDLRRIEIIGPPIEQVRYDFRSCAAFRRRRA